jgi:hypothetical protein
VPIDALAKLEVQQQLNRLVESQSTDPE